MDANSAGLICHIVQINRWARVFGGAREMWRLAAHDRFSQSLLAFTFVYQFLDPVEAEPPEVQQEFMQLRDGHCVVEQLKVDVGEGAEMI